MQLTMKSWSKGLQTVSLIQLIKQSSTGSLIQAKAEVEKLLAGSPVILDFSSEEVMNDFKIKAIDCGVVFD